MDVESGKKPNMLKFNMLFFSQTYNKVLTCFHVFYPKWGDPQERSFQVKNDAKFTLTQVTHDIIWRFTK